MHGHTEGEWYVSPAGSIVLAHGDPGTPDKIVCHLSLTRGPEEAVANGDLVSAAPLMLAALEAQERANEHLAGCRYCRGGYHAICNVAKAAVEAVRNALAAARRGQGVTA